MTLTLIASSSGSDRLKFVIAIAARDYHNLALKDDESVWAWGWNINGQLGDGTTTDRSIPVLVHSLSASAVSDFNLWQ